MTDSSQKRLRKLGSYLRPHWRQAFLGIIALFIVNALGVYIPRLVSQAIDDLEATTQFSGFF